MVFARVKKNRAHTENKNLKSGKLQQQAVLRVKAVTRSRLGQTSKNAREIFVAPQPIENKNEVRTSSAFRVHCQMVQSSYSALENLTT